ncbi:MAG: Hsp70 family protein [Acidobacteriaceae bacterium]|nr:Hsp70 family protein [Acidobacteriaceae bacterium]MBV9779859.1 Hsp70 family protein [Acidobacteriaceae bacterium]
MPEFVIGIDLGTTNSALAYVPFSVSNGDRPEVKMFGVTQLVNPGETAELDLLPSALYLPGESEFVEGALALPWNERPPYITGQFARKRGVENATRLVTSAKSWLSNQSADPTQPILPLTAPEGVKKITPLEASREYLLHFRHAWNQAHPEAKFEHQSVLITVPASFDPAARELTQRAAKFAGYPEAIILEEPQAAFYAWIERNPNWREQVKPGDLILVVDIGGGTTDFSLIAVTEESGELRLDRVAVGEHLLLGGDNMDLAVARYAEQQFAQKGTRLDAIQFNSLWQQCRAAKEVLLSGSSSLPEEHPLTILGRGTGLIGGTIRGKITRHEISSLLLDGFFPRVNADAAPERQRRAALMEVGLNYAADPAVTKHLAQFLRNAAKSAGSGELARPSHLLLNGGVLQAAAIEQRLFEVVNSWIQEAGKIGVIELQNESKQADLMHAVARGAAYYGLARTGSGVRIRGGVPRTYYVGIESSLPAVPGLQLPMKAFTVVPFGLEEGSTIELPQKKFALVVGEPAEFRFFSSLSRKSDAPGVLLEEISEDMDELAPIEVFLPPQDNGAREEVVPVTLESNVTETGMLELWCVAADGRRWKLEFSVRERADGVSVSS